LTPAPLVHHGNPALGFAVDYPRDWEVTDPIERVDPLGEASTATEFRTNLYGYAHQAFGKYVAIVTVKASEGRSLTETVEHSLSPIVPSMREGIEITCCLNVGGKPAMELHLPWPMGGRWGTREIVVVHEEREYRLTFYPRSTLDGVTPSDAAARAAFDTFLRTFTFIPVTATAAPPRPTVTPAPTPTSARCPGSPQQDLFQFLLLLRRQPSCTSRMRFGAQCLQSPLLQILLPSRNRRRCGADQTGDLSNSPPSRSSSPAIMRRASNVSALPLGLVVPAIVPPNSVPWKNEGQ
jgi:hypothetical protein